MTQSKKKRTKAQRKEHDRKNMILLIGTAFAFILFFYMS